MNIQNQSDNSLLKRTELSLVINSHSAPTNLEAAKMLAEHFKKSEETVVIKNIKNKYGTHDFYIEALIYDSLEAKMKVELQKKENKARAGAGAS